MAFKYKIILIVIGIKTERLVAKHISICTTASTSTNNNTNTNATASAPNNKVSVTTERKNQGPNMTLHTHIYLTMFLPRINFIHHLVQEI